MRPAHHNYRSLFGGRKAAFARRLSASAAALFTLAVAACGDGAGGDGGTGPSPVDPVASVSVSPEARTIVVGQSVTLAATARNRLGAPLDGRAISWTSNAPLVASVSAAGRVEALSAGFAIITATSEGRSGSARVDVSVVPVASVQVAPGAVALQPGQTRQLAAQPLGAAGQPLGGRAVAWSSSDTTVATVDSTGGVAAKSAGEAVIRAESEGKAGTAAVTVAASPPAPVARIILSRASLDMERGEAVRLTARVEDANGQVLLGRDVTWSSTDRARVHVSADGTVHALAVGGAGVTASCEGKSADADVLVFAPPAADLVYDRPAQNGGAEIFVLGFGAPSLPVKVNAGNVSREPSPSPDGSRIAFAVSQRDLTTGGWQHDLYVVDRNGMNMRWLTRMAGVEESPAWSPDGSRIAFSGTGTTSSGEPDIWVIGVDGTGLVNLTSAMGSWSSELHPAWSPDGTRIAFATAGYGIMGPVWVMNADGSGAAQLTASGGAQAHPTWSPNGAAIAFAQLAFGGTGSDIVIAPVAGGAVTRLALPGDQGTPVWSPDGDHIAYTHRDVTATLQLYTMRADGTGSRLRTIDAAWGGGRNPSWIAP